MIDVAELSIFSRELAVIKDNYTQYSNFMQQAFSWQTALLEY